MKQEINRYEILEKITPLIENTAVRYNLVPIEIEFVKENHRWFLRIYLYSYDHDITLDDCEKVTRSLNDFLDELIPVKYYLEVSSVGLERELRNIDEIKANIGKYINVKTYEKLTVDKISQKEFEGTLLSCEDNLVTMQFKVKQFKKEITIPYEKIAKIRLAIEF